MDARDVILARKLFGGSGGGGKGGQYDIKSFDNGDTQTLEIVEAAGGITDGIVIKARNADGYPTEIDLYQTTGVLIDIIKGQTNDERTTQFCYLEKINLKFELTELKDLAFAGLSQLKTITGIKSNVFEDVVGLNGWHIFNNCALEGELSFPNLTSLSVNAYTFYKMPNITKLSCPKVTYAHQYFCYGCKSLKELYLPKVTRVNGDARDALGANTALEIAQIGSVGHSVTGIRNNAFNGCTQSNLTITVYTSASYADALLTNVRNGAANATIIIKASEGTTYNDVSYAAGETLITSMIEEAAT